MSCAKFAHYKSIILALTSVLFFCTSGTCFANEYRGDRFNSVFSIKQSKQRGELIPVSIMSNEQLFRAVQAQRDHSMSFEQQRINYNWLLNYRCSEYSGAAAMRKALRTTLQSFRPMLSRSNGNAETKSFENDVVFRDINNYRLRLSDDKVQLGFKYPF